MMDDNIDNVIPFSKTLNTIPEDSLLGEEEIENLHNFVLENLDQVTEKVRNDSNITGAVVITLNESGKCENYIMGSVSLSRLYTTLALYQNNLLDMYAEVE
tara:strand:- start:300 stop:602 length:303 start_codon:yes stop_codon:yes gene_type:complete